MENGDEDLEMVEYSSDEENGGSFAASDVDSEYGEQTLTPRTVTEKNDFYRATVRRQNCFFGVSMVSLAGLFLAAYFFMGLSFTPSNIGIFGDESAMKGSSGEVGLDADNAETQEIVDEEVEALEEAGEWGEMSKAAKRAKTKREKEFHLHDAVGKNKWVENKGWWKKHAPDIDTSNMSKHEKKQYEQQLKQEKRRKKRREKLCKEHPEAVICQAGADTDLGSIREKLGKHYDYEATGKGKENFPEGWPGRPGGGGKHNHNDRDKQKNKDKHGKKNKHKNDPDKEENSNAPDEATHPDNEGGESGEAKDELQKGPGDIEGNEPEPAPAPEENEPEPEPAPASEPVESEPESETEPQPALEEPEENEPEPQPDPAPEPEEPVKEEPVEEEPAEVEPASESEESEPNPDEAKEEHAEEESVKEEPVEENPVEEDPVEEDPVQEDPVEEDPVEEKPAEEEPVEEEPAEVEPAEEEPEETLPSTIVNTFTVLEQKSHDQTSFTQGLSYGPDGTIYETTGLYGNSKVRRIDPTSFEVTKSVDTDRKYFGEGSTYYADKDGNGRLIEITWREQTGFIYDSETLEKLEEFKYTTTPNHGNQGWGITYDPTKEEFIVSDGTQYLYFWDRDTLREKRKVQVTRFDGRLQQDLNELEYMDGLVCCNIWHSDDIICVDPVTGKSIREYDMSSLWPKNQRGGGENVLNGIALGKDHVLLTGKRWDRMYKVVFPDWPQLFR